MPAAAQNQYFVRPTDAEKIREGDEQKCEEDDRAARAEQNQLSQLWTDTEIGVELHGDGSMSPPGARLNRAGELPNQGLGLRARCRRAFLRSARRRRFPAPRRRWSRKGRTSAP